MRTRIQKDFFLQSVALPMAIQGPYERREITVSTNNGLHVCMGWCTTCLCSFSPWAAQKSKFPKLVFFLILWPLTMTIQAVF